MSERPARREAGSPVLEGDFEISADNYGDFMLCCGACRRYWDLDGVQDIATLAQKCISHSCDDAA